MLLRADTTANEYMQELPEIVQEMVGCRRPHARERSRAKHGLGDLQENATQPIGRGNAKLLILVGAAGFEPTTSTV